MKNLIKIYFFVIFICTTGGIFAQVNPRTFTEYSAYVYEQYNITCKIPKNFIDLKYLEVWKFRQESFGAGFVFNPVIQSDNQECILMYPMIFNYISESDEYISKISQGIGRSMFKNKPTVDYGDMLPRNTIKHQLRSVLGHLDKHGDIIRDSIFNVNDYVSVIAGKKVRKSFNADSVFIYDIPLEKAYKEEYVYCTGMVVTKKNRPYMQFMWFFTEEGKKKKDRYIKILSKKVWYNDNEQKSSKNGSKDSGGKNDHPEKLDSYKVEKISKTQLQT